MHDDAHELGDLLIPRQLLLHLALASAEPGLIHVKLPADQFDERLIGACFLTLEVCDHAAGRTETFGKVGLRESGRSADLFDSLVDGH